MDGRGPTLPQGIIRPAVEGEDLECQKKFSGPADTGSPAIDCGKNRRNPATGLMHICILPTQGPRGLRKTGWLH